ncbi:hypothetical protein RJT34_02904 [Clitoria ternatea]|uniref:Uncharacterized protein n=1 Tax=Clitoria ternatea TaxID=43366 RepID=A0AAN9KHX1_CLITE
MIERFPSNRKRRRLAWTTRPRPVPVIPDIRRPRLRIGLPRRSAQVRAAPSPRITPARAIPPRSRCPTSRPAPLTSADLIRAEFGPLRADRELQPTSAPPLGAVAAPSFGLLSFSFSSPTLLSNPSFQKSKP